MFKVLRSEQYMLNPLGQNVSIFPIEDGANIEEDDFVVVNTRTLQASVAKKCGGYYSVGRAIRIVSDENGKNKQVICNDGIYFIHNTELPEHRIGDYNIGRICYFDGPSSVTLDNINTTRAGEVLNLDEDGNVLIKISIIEGSELEW